MESDQPLFLSPPTKKVQVMHTLIAKVVREEFPRVEGAFHLHNVLSKEECDYLIKVTEAQGYDNSTHPNYQNTYIDNIELKNRSNIRFVWEAPEEYTNKLLTQRVKQFLPTSIYEDRWHLEGVNNMWRFYRYECGQKFGMHFDNQFKKSYSVNSHFSFLVYLNDDFEGGETTFFKFNKEIGHFDRFPVKPKQGSVLVFYHTGNTSPLHEGTEHTTLGKQKYVLRSDVMFKRNEKDPY